MNKKFDEEYIQRLAEILANKYHDNFKKAKKVLKRDFEIELNSDNLSKFRENFCERYKYVLQEYMNQDVKVLDRHKVSAVAIIEFILSDILIYEEPRHGIDEIFMIKYDLATQTGLAFMQYWFNNLLEAKGESAIIEWHWPQLLSCPENSYFRVFARNLYYTEQSIKKSGERQYVKAFNELELAEKLFLFEYITIIKEGIEPMKLAEEESP